MAEQQPDAFPALPEANASIPSSTTTPTVTSTDSALPAPPSTNFQEQIIANIKNLPLEEQVVEFEKYLRTNLTMVHSLASTVQSQLTFVAEATANQTRLDADAKEREEENAQLKLNLLHEIEQHAVYKERDGNWFETVRKLTDDLKNKDDTCKTHQKQIADLEKELFEIQNKPGIKLELFRMTEQFNKLGEEHREIQRHHRECTPIRAQVEDLRKKVTVLAEELETLDIAAVQDPALRTVQLWSNNWRQIKTKKKVTNAEMTAYTHFGHRLTYPIKNTSSGLTVGDVLTRECRISHEEANNYQVMAVQHFFLERDDVLSEFFLSPNRKSVFHIFRNPGPILHDLEPRMIFFRAAQEIMPPPACKTTTVVQIPSSPEPDLDILKAVDGAPAEPGLLESILESTKKEFTYGSPPTTPGKRKKKRQSEFSRLLRGVPMAGTSGTRNTDQQKKKRSKASRRRVSFLMHEDRVCNPKVEHLPLLPSSEPSDDEGLETDGVSTPDDFPLSNLLDTEATEANDILDDSDEKTSSEMDTDEQGDEKEPSDGSTKDYEDATNIK